MEDEFNLDGIPMRWESFYWSGCVDIPLPFSSGGRPVEIGIATRDEEQVEPCPEQLAAWRSFVEHSGTIYERSLNAALDYYEEVRPHYARMGPGFVARMPIPIDAKGIASMIRLSSLKISWPYDGANVRIGAVFGCDWEQEHGLGIVYEQNKIVAIGLADCAA